MPSLAAWAVRTLARTEIDMPIYPVAPESTAPTKNPKAVSQSSTKPSTRNNTTPTMAMVVYWRFKYALAPCWMAAAISCIRSVPAGLASTHWIETMP